MLVSFQYVRQCIGQAAESGGDEIWWTGRERAEKKNVEMLLFFPTFILNIHQKREKLYIHSSSVWTLHLALWGGRAVFRVHGWRNSTQILHAFQCLVSFHRVYHEDIIALTLFAETKELGRRWAQARDCCEAKNAAELSGERYEAVEMWAETKEDGWVSEWERELKLTT